MAQTSQGQILVLAFRQKYFQTFKRFNIRSEPVGAHRPPRTTGSRPCRGRPTRCLRSRARGTWPSSRRPTTRTSARGKGNSNSHGARPVHLITTMIKWFRTSRLSTKNYLCLHAAHHQPSESDQIAFFHPLGLYWSSPESGNLQRKQGVSKRRCAPTRCPLPRARGTWHSRTADYEGCVGAEFRGVT